MPPDLAEFPELQEELPIHCVETLRRWFQRSGTLSTSFNRDLVFDYCTDFLITQNFNHRDAWLNELVDEMGSSKQVEMRNF